MIMKTRMTDLIINLIKTMVSVTVLTVMMMMIISNAAADDDDDADN